MYNANMMQVHMGHFTTFSLTLPSWCADQMHVIHINRYIIILIRPYPLHLNSKTISFKLIYTSRNVLQCFLCGSLCVINELVLIPESTTNNLGSLFTVKLYQLRARSKILVEKWEFCCFIYFLAFFLLFSAQMILKHLKRWKDVLLFSEQLVY